MKRRSGVGLMDILMTLSLFTVALALSSALITRVWKIDQKSVEADRAARGIEQVLTLLRRDVVDAEALTVDTRRLTAGGVSWEIGSDQIVRVEGAEKQSWDLKTDALRFESSPYGAILVGRESRVPLLNDVAWAKGALK